MTEIAFVSGHLDLTSEEFSMFYQPILEIYIDMGWQFVVGDANGADYMTQLFLANHPKKPNFTIYHMLTGPRFAVDCAPRIGGFENDEQRDEAMTAGSDVDIAWVRPGRERSGTSKNIRRRAKWCDDGNRAIESDIKRRG